MMKLNAMVLEVIKCSDKFSKLIIKEAGTENTLVCSIYTDRTNEIEVGSTYIFEVSFRVKEKKKETERLHFQNVLVEGFKKMEE